MFFSSGSNTFIIWVTSLFADPYPISIVIGSLIYWSANYWTSFGQVAENKTVCLNSGVFLNKNSNYLLNPYSSILSASSTTTNETLLKSNFFISTKSLILPGVPIIA